jgi:hypothetical protein
MQLDLPASAITLSPDQYTLIAPTRQDTYNSVAKYDPATRTAELFGSESLLPTTASDEDPTYGLAGVSVDLASEHQGIYDIQWQVNGHTNKAVLTITADPGVATSNVLVIVPDYTWQAYDASKGGSFYGDGIQHADGRHFAYGVTSEFPNGRHMYAAVNMNRPMSFAPISGSEYEMNRPWFNPIEFLNSHLFSGSAPQRVDVVLQSQIASGNYDLGQYSELVLYGHDEYWTPELFSAIRNAVNSGSSLLNMSGNTGYRRIVQTGTVIHFDLEHASSAQLNAPLWGSQVLPISQANDASIWGVLPTPFSAPEKPTDFLGVDYLYYPLAKNTSNSGIKNICKVLKTQSKDFKADCKNKLKATQGFSVLDAANRLFRGTSLKTGQYFGKTSKALAYEVDGLPYRKGKLAIKQDDVNSGGYEKTAATQVYSSFRDKSWGSLKGYKSAALVQRHYGAGRILSIGSIGWVSGILANDTIVQKITLNALDDLLQVPTSESSSTEITGDVNRGSKRIVLGTLHKPGGMKILSTINCFRSNGQLQSCTLKIDKKGALKVTSKKLKKISRVNLHLDFEPDANNYFVLERFEMSQTFNL